MGHPRPGHRARTVPAADTERRPRRHVGLGLLAQLYYVTPGLSSANWDSSDSSRPLTGEDLVEQLGMIDPRVAVTTDVHVDSSVLGVRVPGPVAVVLAVISAAVLLLLVRGPLPDRGSRWAWFWLLATPTGLVAFLVLGGPLQGYRAPDARRLSGWTGLLLSLLIAGLTTWSWS